MKTGILRFKQLPTTLELTGFPSDIPIIEGSHKYEIDVREELIDKEVIARQRHHAKRAYFLRCGKQPAPEVLNRPMGFNISSAEAAGGEIIWDEDKLNAEVKK